jgi:hypothetical protein
MQKGYILYVINYRFTVKSCFMLSAGSCFLMKVCPMPCPLTLSINMGCRCLSEGQKAAEEGKRKKKPQPQNKTKNKTKMGERERERVKMRQEGGQKQYTKRIQQKNKRVQFNHMIKYTHAHTLRNYTEYTQNSRFSLVHYR